MAGLAPISLQQRCGIDGRPYSGAKAYFYEAATLTPILTYQDYGLGARHPFPVEANEYGVFPAIFIDEAVGFYRLKITTADGGTLDDLVTLAVYGPGEGGGGSEVPVDPTALFQTGHPQWLPIAGARAGWVRANARTIGSASSGATERANADCEQLYLYLHNTYPDTMCPVTGGRGGSAAADWAADKPIGTLDMRNVGAFGLPDMGSTNTGAFAGLTFSVGDATTPGSKLGASTVVLEPENLPSDTVPVTIPAGEGRHSHPIQMGSNDTPSTAIPKYSGPVGSIISGDTGEETLPEMHGTADTGGEDAPVNKMPPGMLGTWYIKLAVPFAIALLTLSQGGVNALV